MQNGDNVSQMEEFLQCTQVTSFKYDRRAPQRTLQLGFYPLLDNEAEHFHFHGIFQEWAFWGAETADGHVPADKRALQISR